MARSAKRKLPKSIRQAIDAQQRDERASEAIAPMRRENPILERPPEVHRPHRKALPAPAQHNPPSGTPYSAHIAQPLLSDGHTPDDPHAFDDPLTPHHHQPTPDTETLLQQVGAQVLISHEAEQDDVCSFWITLKDNFLDGIQIRITLDRGRVSARLLVASHHTVDFIRQRLPRLRERFQKRGMHLDEIEVIVA